MWDLIHDERYVSNPAVNRGRHTRGTAVDVTLVDKHGNELAMPSPFDDFTTAAHRDSPTMTPEQRANMMRLQAVMTKHGFEPYPPFQKPEIPVKITGTIKEFFTDSVDPEDWTFPSRYKIKRELLRSMAPNGLFAHCAMLQALRTRS